MADDSGWHLVGTHTSAEKLEEKQIDEWERSKAHWSGIGKHAANFTEHYKVLKVQESVQLGGGSQLGSGGYGTVQRVICKGVVVARKAIPIQPRRNFPLEKLREEANAMERLSHKHILKLVGTYTLKKEFFLLLYPAAVCDLSRFLEDIGDVRSGTAAERDDALTRIRLLGLSDEISSFAFLQTPKPHTHNKNLSTKERESSTPMEFLQQSLGCITEALCYVHEQGIRHRDLKPKNILMSPSRVYLADFGISRDVLEMENSITSGKCGSPSYIPPEVHEEMDHRMSPADIWSLGCVFLNIGTLLYGGCLENCEGILKEKDWKKKMRDLDVFLTDLGKTARDGGLEDEDMAGKGFGGKHIVGLIRDMLKLEPSERPTAREVNKRFTALGGLDQSYHLRCCHKDNAFIQGVINKKLQSIYERNLDSALQIAKLKAENDKFKERLAVLEESQTTWEQRLAKGIKHVADQYKAQQKVLQEKFDREVEENNKLKEKLKSQGQGNKPSRKPRSQNRGRGRSQGTLHPNGVNPNPHPHPYPDPNSKSPSNANGDGNNNRNGNRNSNGNRHNYSLSSFRGNSDSAILDIQRRQSKSYLPQPSRPTTPLRPILSQDTGSATSTLVSSVHSKFSRASLERKESFSSVDSMTLRSLSPESPTAKKSSEKDEDERIKGEKGKASLPSSPVLKMSVTVKTEENRNAQVNEGSKGLWTNLFSRPLMST